MRMRRIDDVNVLTQNVIEEADSIKASAINAREHLKLLIPYLSRLETELNNAAHRFDFISKNTQCIGASLCHVDGNCISCLAAQSRETAYAVLKDTH